MLVSVAVMVYVATEGEGEQTVDVFLTFLFPAYLEESTNVEQHRLYNLLTSCLPSPWDGRILLPMDKMRPAKLLIGQ